jgi:beta-galactosidase
MIYAVLSLLTICQLSSGTPHPDTTSHARPIEARRDINFNAGWEFLRIDAKSDSAAGGDRLISRDRVPGKKWADQFHIRSVDEGGESTTASLEGEMRTLMGRSWEKITLPHTATIESLLIRDPWEGIAYYRKRFTIDRALRGRRVTIEFGGVMQLADVWFNGKHLCQHSGGYLPFTIDITESATYGGSNLLFLRVSNRDNPLIPPGKPVRQLDFLYYSGIYRNVWMHVTGPLHITDAVTAEKPRGGGIFVTYRNVTDTDAAVNVKTHVTNDDARQRAFSVLQEMVDTGGNVVASVTGVSDSLRPHEDRHSELSFHITHPLLWHPDHPYLYTLRTSVKDGRETVDEVRTRIGIRSYAVSPAEGLKINGRPFRIRGTNRHMAYPWIGNAVAKNANYRDMWLIKNAGMNCVRLAHYPQDPSVYDACDELGLLVVDCIPGWQFFNKNRIFTDRVFRDIREMIRRDRNHPCVLLWEVSLNETYPPAEFRCEQAAVARSEFIGDNFLTSGDSYFTKACWDVPYDDWNDNPAGRDNTTYPDRAYLVREYGDYEFGGGSSTTRQLRRAGEYALLQQAWNLQWSHDHNRFQYPRCIGDLNWSMYDGLAGGTLGIEAWGPADILRIPKFSYYFFQSQRDPRNAGPAVFAATYWTERASPSKVVIYSNCDEVELLVNGRSVGRQKPDKGPDTPYGTEYDMGGKPFDGGNCRNLEHAPFTFTGVRYEAGELKAVGFLLGTKVAEHRVFTPGQPAGLAIEIALGPKPLSADGADVVFVRAYILDAEGHPVPTAENSVRFTVTGDAHIVSPSETKAEAGIATVLLQAGGKKGKISVRATSDGLTPGEHTFNSVE